MRLSTTEIRFLTLQEKVQYIRHHGVYGHSRRENSYQIQVYQLGAYEAELWMHIASRQVHKVAIKE
ncbi:hypothetical protein GXP67_17875 [Rhodocytophaga rosea]|uniref:Uncharacterized protein n=1 Tax=Rhodocytophaga rosea TaxID=2704465 RepID=A0A6C0GK15_9BACT|nr:hypothetical protein [Rhodocytophaga rosea]QHT68376.1 hypothetical protein GXP67_17875 [Rhodocytophaga rosea]